MQKSVDDSHLIDGCLKGRKDAWDLFVSRYSRLVYWSIWNSLENQNIPNKEDFCQDTFQDLFQKILEHETLERLRQVKNIKTYLRAMACHLVFDKIRNDFRKNQREDSFETLEIKEDVLMVNEDASKQLIRKEMGNAMEPVMSSLSAKERACVELCYLDGRTHREIGLLLNLPQDTVSTILRRAKERLRLAIEQKGILE